MFERETVSGPFDPQNSETTSPANQPIIGIWRLGQPIHHGDGTELHTVQPAESPGNPRFDYVLKRVSGANAPAHASRRILQTIRSGRVRHPNLIAVLDASDSAACPYVVMPKLDAEPMNRRIAAMADFPLPVALWWTRQAAEALAALHAANQVHGDVHPGNLMVDAKGHVTLIDLGHAARVHSPMPPIFRGTGHYAAPELVAGTIAALPAMDIHALGQILWECLATASAATAAFSESIADLIQNMIATEPEDRPTAREVTQTLLRLEIESLGGHFRSAA